MPTYNLFPKITNGCVTHHLSLENQSQKNDITTSCVSMLGIGKTLTLSTTTSFQTPLNPREKLNPRSQPGGAGDFPEAKQLLL